MDRMLPGWRALSTFSPREVYKCLKSSLLPQCCILCGGQSHTDMAVCEGCLADLPFNLFACSSCALPVPASGMLCASCLSNKTPWQACHGVFSYQDPLPGLIQAMKFHGKLSYARLLGEIMGQWLALYAQKPQVIIPVPVHARRMRERGFNQAVEISRPVARDLQLDMDLDYCRKIRSTPDQVGLAAKQRQTNVRGAFALSDDRDYEYVALLDDVMTTGSTLREICRLLHEHGVQRVDVWVVARATGF